MLFKVVKLDLDVTEHRLKSPVAELQKVARDEKVSFGMATLHFVGKFESQVYYQTLWYSYYYLYL